MEKHISSELDRAPVRRPLRHSPDPKHIDGEELRSEIIETVEYLTRRLRARHVAGELIEKWCRWAGRRQPLERHHRSALMRVWHLAAPGLEPRAQPATILVSVVSGQTLTLQASLSYRQLTERLTPSPHCIDTYHGLK